MILPDVITAPSSLAEAMQFAEDLRTRPNRVAVSPGPDHWRIFRSLCDAVGALDYGRKVTLMVIRVSTSTPCSSVGS